MVGDCCGGRLILFQVKYILMEAKLTEYRARKRRETAKQFLYNVVTFNSQQHAGGNERNVSVPCQQEDGNMSVNSCTSHTSDVAGSAENNISEVDITSPKLASFTAIIYTLYISLWTTLYAVAINLEFGTVYLIVSILYVIWKNTRTGPKKQGEVSAYSVFNRNCEAIDGTLTAEQFEQEIRYGPLNVH